MSGPIDFSWLDKPEILEFVFYPRTDWTPLPPGARDYSIPVEDGISIGCRFYPHDKESPLVLYFHGNGEVIYDYDGIAPLYNREGIGLFVADYRGYGQSGGRPSFGSTVKDAHSIFSFFKDTLREEGYSGRLYVMGRSLGSLSAVELAAGHSADLTGFMIESGFASAGKFFRYFSSDRPGYLVEFEKANEERLRSITLPALIIHGERDEIIPHEQARLLYEHLGSKVKKLITIPHAGHNDIMLIGLESYFTAVREFIFRDSLS